MGGGGSSRRVVVQEASGDPAYVPIKGINAAVVVGEAFPAGFRRSVRDLVRVVWWCCRGPSAGCFLRTATGSCGRGRKVGGEEEEEKLEPVLGRRGEF
ncbi:hypothetical protein Taro_024545 [Colocasia esculenta]|uniref:Uncharacterized protein n=1 Tax=Colocasia esculenta TaxID=4460 RepID=A0A843V725_COLES|nr:hypothetical protein [Colocasia esculenta]